MSTVQAQIAKAAHMELAQHDLVAFAKLALPWFEAPPHIQYLAGQLEELERSIGTAERATRRLALNCPPGHGKSTLTQTLIAFLIGRNPSRRVLAVSGNQSLARRNSRAIRNMVQSPDWPFPCKLVGESLEEWYTSADGGVRAIGREGQLTGFRAELILLDDIQPDAGTETSRADDEAWLREIMSTRLEPGGAVVMISTRWHESDLVGVLQEGRNRRQWKFINLPALCVDPKTDPIHRNENDALWPQRWPVESLEERREEVGSVGFSTQYQGSPVPPEGRMIQRAWFPRYTLGAHPKLKKIIFGVDCASTIKKTSDNSAIVVVGLTQNGDSYVLDCVAEKVEFFDLVHLLQNTYDRWNTGGVPVHVYVETASAGTQLVQVLKSESGIPVRGIPTGVKAKEERVALRTPAMEAGKVHLPISAPFLDALCDELFSFPIGRHDDRVDALCLALEESTKKRFSYAGVFDMTGMCLAESSSGGSSVIQAIGEPYTDAGQKQLTECERGSHTYSGDFTCRLCGHKAA